MDQQLQACDRWQDGHGAAPATSSAARTNAIDASNAADPEQAPTAKPTTDAPDAANAAALAQAPATKPTTTSTILSTQESLSSIDQFSSNHVDI